MVTNRRVEEEEGKDICKEISSQGILAENKQSQSQEKGVTWPFYACERNNCDLN